MKANAKTKAALVKYVTAASNLADSVKRNVQKDGVVDNKTVLALNDFIIAANVLADITLLLTEEMETDKLKLN